MSSEQVLPPPSSFWRHTLIIFVTLMIFWLMLTSSLAADSLLLGVLVSFAIALFFREGLSFFTEFRYTPEAVIAGFQYYGYFFKELFKSNFRLAAIVIAPSLPIDPGIVKVRTKLKTRMGRLMLANSITLTPGTLTLALEGEYLYVHWVKVEAEDIEAATKALVEGFEYYLEIIYG